MTNEFPPKNKHVLILVLLRSVENGAALTLDEFMRCSEPGRDKDKLKAWYRRWLREMKNGRIVTRTGGKTLDPPVRAYVNAGIAMFAKKQHDALNAAIDRL